MLISPAGSPIPDTVLPYSLTKSLHEEPTVLQGHRGGEKRMLTKQQTIIEAELSYQSGSQWFPLPTADGRMRYNAGYILCTSYVRRPKSCCRRELARGKQPTLNRLLHQPDIASITEKNEQTGSCLAGCSR